MSVNAILGPPSGRVAGTRKAPASVPAGDPKCTKTVRQTLKDGAQRLAVSPVTDALAP